MTNFEEIKTKLKEIFLSETALEAFIYIMAGILTFLLSIALGNSVVYIIAILLAIFTKTKYTKKLVYVLNSSFLTFTLFKWYLAILLSNFISVTTVILLAIDVLFPIILWFLLVWFFEKKS